MSKVRNLSAAREGKFQTKLLEELKKFRPYACFFKVVRGNVNGIPDLVGSVGGVFMAVELKVDDKNPSPLQRHCLEQVAKTGG